MTTEIRVISEKQVDLAWEIRKFCLFCALTSLAELENSDYQFKDKFQIIKNIRATLLKNSSGEEKLEILDCYA